MTRSIGQVSYMTVSEATLIELCHSGKLPWVGGCEYGDRVVRITSDAVIKFGPGVSRAEALTQDYAYSHIDPTLLRIPRVYRYFTNDSNPSWTIGYLVMEFIEGKSLDKFDSAQRSHYAATIKTCLEYLWSIPVPSATQPGPVGGGQPKGYLWGDYGACTTFATTSELEDWLNKRLEIDRSLESRGYYDLPGVSATSDSIHDRLTLPDRPLVMCHGDIVDRNIIVQADDTICLLDWGFSGFYPYIFELYAVKACKSDSPDLLKPLMNLLGDTVSCYTKDLALLARIQRINIACPM